MPFEIVAGHSPGWVSGALGCAFVVVVGLELALFVRRAGPSSSRLSLVGLVLLRVVAILALAVLFFELTLRFEAPLREARGVVVLVDRSASMAIADRVGDQGPAVSRQSRAEAVWAASESTRAHWASEGSLVEVRGFDEESHPLRGIEAQTLGRAPLRSGQSPTPSTSKAAEVRKGPSPEPSSSESWPTGVASDLTGALEDLRARSAGGAPGLGAVVVVSDGLVAADAVADERLLEVARRLEVPVTTVFVGAKELRDVSVVEVRAGEFAFAENVTHFEADVVAHGFSGTRVEASLARNGEVVETKSFVVGQDGATTTLRFRVVPDRVGAFVYEVRIPALTDEATLANNRRPFVVKVLRDKLRALHVAGRPDWDVRALRTLLRRDPNVELLSYYILRDPNDFLEEDATSLIPFPTDELFKEELGSFDVVFLHNFDFVQHDMTEYAGNLAKYVLEGGALVLVGGDLGLGNGDYGAPPMSRILPFDDAEALGLDETAFRPTLTEVGRRHPVTSWVSLVPGGLARLPALDTWNPVRPSHARGDLAANVLWTHPTAKTPSGEPRPILAVSEPRRGRVVALATGASWRLGFAPDLEWVEGVRPYDLLWRSILRWLLRDDAGERLTLTADAVEVGPSDPIELEARAVSAGYAPEPGVAIEWTIEPIAEATPSLPANPEPREGDATEANPRSGRVITDGLGRARMTVGPLPVGAYVAIARRVEPLRPEANEPAASVAQTTDQATAVFEARRVFLVTLPGQELSWIDADPGETRLARLANLTGGGAYRAIDADVLPRDLAMGHSADLAARVERLATRKDVPLGQGWALWLLVCVVFPAEWWWRRRLGHL